MSLCTTWNFQLIGMLDMFAARSGRRNGHRPRRTDGGQQDGKILTLLTLLLQVVKLLLEHLNR